MRTAGRAGVALAAALVVVSCSSDDEARDTLPPPTQPPSGGAVTSAGPPATTPVSTAATSSTSTSTSSTTSSSTTSTAIAGPGPSTEAAAVLMGGPGGFPWAPIGWWNGSEWVRAGAEGATEIPVAPGDPVQVITMAGTAPAVVGEADLSCFEQLGFDVPAEVPDPDPPGYGYSALAVNAPWPVQPRPLTEAGSAVDEYEQIAEQFAAGLGVDATPGDVVQVARVDLDGDGIEEVVVVFERIQESIRGAPGDVSIVYARFPRADGSVTDQLVTSSVVVGEDLPEIGRFRVLGAGDLNGDGVMELMLRSWYWEGAGVSVWERRGDELVGVLDGSCGS